MTECNRAFAGGRISYVEVNGLRLRVWIRGEGPPLLLITGIGANIEMWEPLLARLDGHELITFDPPGAGFSSRTPRPVRMATLARIVVAMLDRLGYKRVSALGYSFGGALAQQLAHEAPERIDRLVLCGTLSGLGGTVPARPLTFLHMLTPYRYYSRRYLERISPHLFGGRSRREPSVVHIHEEARLAAPPSVLGYVWQVAAIWGWSSVPWLHKIEHPTLVMTGDDDPIARPVNSRFLAWRIPNATLHVVPGGGHLFLLDDADSAAPVIIDFLSAR
jgi:poly(3-hydroxyalkanoate) depolymerase